MVSHRIRWLLGIMAGTAVFLTITTGMFMTDPALVMDMVTIALVFLLCSSLYLSTPRKYTTHASGIISLLILLILLVSIMNIVLQLLLILLVIGNSIYFLFYLGIYTACIDQARDEGITSEEFIKDFTFRTGQHGEEERGFLKKARGGAR